MSDYQLRETVFEGASGIVDQLTRIADLLEKRLPGVKAEPATKAETQPASVEPTPSMAQELSDRLIQCSADEETETLRRWLDDYGLCLVDSTASKPEEPKQPPLQWVDWKEGMVVEDGLYPVVVGAVEWLTIRLFRGDRWHWPDGEVCGPHDQATRYFPHRIPAPAETRLSEVDN